MLFTGRYDDANEAEESLDQPGCPSEKLKETVKVATKLPAKPHCLRMLKTGQ